MNRPVMSRVTAGRLHTYASSRADPKKDQNARSANKQTRFSCVNRLWARECGQTGDPALGPGAAGLGPGPSPSLPHPPQVTGLEHGQTWH